MVAATSANMFPAALRKRGHGEAGRRPGPRRRQSGRRGRPVWYVCPFSQRRRRGQARQERRGQMRHGALRHGRPVSASKRRSEGDGELEGDARLFRFQRLWPSLLCLTAATPPPLLCAGGGCVFSFSRSITARQSCGASAARRSSTFRSPIRSFSISASLSFSRRCPSPFSLQQRHAHSDGSPALARGALQGRATFNFNRFSFFSLLVLFHSLVGLVLLSPFSSFPLFAPPAPPAPGLGCASARTDLAADVFSVKVERLLLLLAVFQADGDALALLEARQLDANVRRLSKAEEVLADMEGMGGEGRSGGRTERGRGG